MTHYEYLKSLVTQGWEKCWDSPELIEVLKDNILLMWCTRYRDVIIATCYSQDSKSKVVFKIHNQEDIKMFQ